MKRYIVKFASENPKKTVEELEVFMAKYKEVVLSITESFGDLRLEFISQKETEILCDIEFDILLADLKVTFAECIYAIRDCTIEEAVVEKLIEKDRSISCAESCTGGLLCGRLVNVAGVSAVLDQSYVTYANSAKTNLLGVMNETLRLHGAVSENTAMEMAFGVAKAAKSFYGLSVTGIAGPDGGTKDKPVGLVYVGCSELDIGAARKLQLAGDRYTIRQTAVTMALKFLYDIMMRSQK